MEFFRSEAEGSDGVKGAVAPIMACFMRIKTIRGRTPAASCGVFTRHVCSEQRSDKWIESVCGFRKMRVALSLRIISASLPDPHYAFELLSITRKLMRKGGKRF